MKSVKIVGIVVVAIGLAPVLRADELDQWIERCRASSSERHEIRRCVEEGRDRIAAVLADLREFEADPALADLSHRTGIEWGVVAHERGRKDFMQQSAAFEYCLKMNPESERTRVAEALGYNNAFGKWEQHESRRRMSRRELRSRLLPGDVYLPARADFERVRAEELGYDRFWSSSVRPGYSDRAYVFVGEFGTIYNENRSGSDHAVRCVRR